jgi:Golgi phosphoprotein 3 (GPP34)
MMMLALPLADELFLVGHDEYTGKPLISDNVLDTGLAGAVLGELVLSGRVHVGEDSVVIPYDQRPHGERVTDAALAEVLKQRDGHPVRSWVEYLRDHSRMMVAPRLMQKGLIERVQARVMLKQTIRYPAIDRMRAASPRARLRFLLDHPASLDEQSAVLGGLVRATAMEYVVGGGSPRDARDGLERMEMALRAELRTLIAGVDAAVAAIALSAHR